MCWISREVLQSYVCPLGIVHGEGATNRCHHITSLSYSKDTLSLLFFLPKKTFTGDFAEYFINRLLKTELGPLFV